MEKLVLPKTLNLLSKIEEESSFIHVIIGPRQVGKTTAAKQICQKSKLKSHIQSADGAVLRSPEWLKIVWNQAINNKIELLVIDEIQKVENWSEVVKEMWDQREENFRVLLLGSSSLEIHKGLSESLAGRFRLHKFYHWNFFETNDLMNMKLDDFLIFGGYPGSYALTSDLDDWVDYIQNSIIDPVIGKDILSLVHVKSPALFRQCFDLICSYAAQEISYTKLLGQLQDKGNTDLVKHYIELFEAAFLIKSLPKYSGKDILKRSSSPKLLPLCPALYSSVKGGHYSEEDYGHALEVLVGSYLNSLAGKLYYWREGNFEVDFVFETHNELHAIEVKYGQVRSTKGLEKFLQRFPHARTHIITKENFERIFDF